MSAIDPTTRTRIEHVVSRGDMFNIERDHHTGKVLRKFRVIEIDLDQSRETEQIKSKVRTQVKTALGNKAGADVEVIEEAVCARRKQDDRLFDSLERHPKPLVRAFELIRFGFQLATSDFKAAIARYGNDVAEATGETPSQEWFMDVERNYLQWADEVIQRHGGNSSFTRVIDIVVEGMSCRQTDAKWRKLGGKTIKTSNGSSMKHLINMLEVYCDMMHRNKQPGWGAQ